MIKFKPIALKTTYRLLKEKAFERDKTALVDKIQLPPPYKRINTYLYADEPYYSGLVRVEYSDSGEGENVHQRIVQIMLEEDVRQRTVHQTTLEEILKRREDYTITASRSEILVVYRKIPLFSFGYSYPSSELRFNERSLNSYEQFETDMHQICKFMGTVINAGFAGTGTIEPDITYSISFS